MPRPVEIDKSSWDEYKPLYLEDIQNQKDFNAQNLAGALGGQNQLFDFMGGKQRGSVWDAINRMMTEGAWSDQTQEQMQAAGQAEALRGQQSTMAQQFRNLRPGQRDPMTMNKLTQESMDTMGQQQIENRARLDVQKALADFDALRSGAQLGTQFTGQEMDARRGAAAMTTAAYMGQQYVPTDFMGMAGAEFNMDNLEELLRFAGESSSEQAGAQMGSSLIQALVQLFGPMLF